MPREPVYAPSVATQPGKTIYPEPYAQRVAGRIKRKLGDLFGLTNFGVNMTRLAPGAASALLHRHSRQDEFIFVLEGQLLLRVGGEEYPLRAGDCYGFKAGNGEAHQLVNRSDADGVYLEIGDRTAGDAVEYPEDDLALEASPDGGWKLLHKDGRPY